MYKKKSLSNLVLLALEKSVDGFIRIEDMYRRGSQYAESTYLPKSQLSQAIKRLREKGLVDFVSDEQIAIKLTDPGKERAVLAKLFIDDQKWDGKWRIIMFDIPEKRRLARDVLRSKLKSWGFIPYQQSVWITKKNCTNPLKAFINQAGIKDWVKIFEANKIDF